MLRGRCACFHFWIRFEVTLVSFRVRVIRVFIFVAFVRMAGCCMIVVLRGT